MKVLIVNTFDRDGGAARSARRLHRGLRAIGVDSRMLVLEKTGDDPHTDVKPRILRDQLPLFDALPLVMYRDREVTHWSNTYLPGSIEREIRAFNPDVVHLHWINRGMLNVRDLARWGKPVVGTLHDHWPFTGGCHYPAKGCERYREACGACPALGSTQDRDLSRWNWTRKANAWQDLPLQIIGPSRWLAERAAASSLFEADRCQALPNGIDLTLYRPGDRNVARSELGLPRDKPLIFMVAMNPHQDPNKGGALALEAVRLAAEELGPDAAELLVAGEPERPGAPKTPWPVRRMGVITEEEQMVRLYQAADVQVVPSYLENLSNALMEGGACGLPRIAFRAGGNADLVEDGVGGLLVEPYDPAGLAAGLVNLIRDPDLRQRMGQAAREHMLSFAEIDAVSRRHLEVYEQVVRS